MDIIEESKVNMIVRMSAAEEKGVGEGTVREEEEPMNTLEITKTMKLIR